jgi:hypothetical protein
MEARHLEKVARYQHGAKVKFHLIKERKKGIYEQGFYSLSLQICASTKIASADSLGQASQ